MPQPAGLQQPSGLHQPVQQHGAQLLIRLEAALAQACSTSTARQPGAGGDDQQQGASVTGACMRMPTPSEAVWQVLQPAYSEPGRHYHTLEHLAGMFECLDEATALSPSPSDFFSCCVPLAVFFHDAVLGKNNT